MSNLLRGMLVLCVAGLLMAGCNKKEEPAPVVVAPAAAPAAVAPAAAPAVAAPSTSGGGYEPTAEERIPGITQDAAAPAADATPAEAAPAAVPAPAEAAPAEPAAK